MLVVVKLIIFEQKNNMKIEVSVGEVLDKLSILSIKLSKIEDTDKLRNVAKELSLLTKALPKGMLEDSFYTKLCRVNMMLWDVEDKLREMESREDFSNDFITLARSVYILNDQRAAIKKEINIKYNSNLIEEKSYKQY